jgi:hypothetical protein
VQSSEHDFQGMVEAKSALRDRRCILVMYSRLADCPVSFRGLIQFITHAWNSYLVRASILRRSGSVKVLQSRAFLLSAIFERPHYFLSLSSRNLPEGLIIEGLADIVHSIQTLYSRKDVRQVDRIST